MRIWLAPSAYFPHQGGVEELTFQLASEYQRKGHDVLVVANRHPTGLPSREVLDGILVERVSFSAPRRSLKSLIVYPRQLLAQLWRLDRLLRSARPDIIHVQCPSVQLLSIVVLACIRRVPLILTSQGEVVMDAHDLYGRSAFMRAVLRWASTRATTLTACSTWTVDRAARIAPRFVNAKVVPNGVDPRQWLQGPEVEGPLVCAWGRHVPQKGLDLLIEAFADVRQELLGARLMVGGSGPDTGYLRELAGEGVELVGPLGRSEVQDLLNRSRVAVVPSRLEPFGIVAVEAMAVGRPVVWSTEGGLSQATGGLGWGVDPTDRAALAAAIVAALRSHPDPATLRAHAERLSWERIGEEYLGIYRAATASASGGSVGVR